MNCKLLVILGGALLLPGLVHAQASNSARPEKTEAAEAIVPGAPNAFLDTFAKHWATAKGLGVAIAEAMPAESYDFKPNPEEMSFGEQMMHVASANFGYCAALTDAKSPVGDLPKDARIVKADAVKQLGASFDYCSEVFGKLKDAQMELSHARGERKFTTRDIMLGVMIHMVHHRGQAEVYLRLKGIKPPDYKW